MRTFTGNLTGKILVIDFERDELLLEKTIEELQKAGIKNGVLISGIGTFDKARIHRVVTFDEKPVEEFIDFDAPMELSAIQGIVADGVPHFHVVFSDLENTYSGHLETGCRVLYLAELVIAETDLELERRPVGYVNLLHRK